MEGAFGYRGQRLLVETAKTRSENKLSPVNHFAAEMDHFSECVLTSTKPRTPGEEGLADVRVIAAIKEAVESGRQITIAR